MKQQIPGCKCCGAPPGPPTIPIAGCFCAAVPQNLSLTVTYGPGETAATYGNGYVPASLAYYDNAAYGLPPYWSGSFFGAAWYSTALHVDNVGQEFYYRLSCFSSQFSLGIGQKFGPGNFGGAGQIYNWAMGGGVNAVNFCNPFGLLVGQKQQGVGFNGKFVVTG